jgi:hypothetical protein
MKQRFNKITRNECLILANKAKRVDALLYENKNLKKIWGDFIDTELFWNFSSVISKLGSPLVTMPDYESNPGIWIFDDEPTGITFLIWSDCHRANSYKGTSYECITSEKNIAEIGEAFKRLIDYLSIKCEVEIKNEDSSIISKVKKIFK